MKNECNIVRDLMPLVIDGVASEESTQMVEEHVADCEPCAEVYEELKGEIHTEALVKEQAEFEKAARKMRQARNLRMASLLIVVVLLTGIAVWYAVPKHDQGLMPLRSINVKLCRIPDTDKVYLLIYPKKAGQSIGFSLTNDWRKEGLFQSLVVEDKTDTPYVPFYHFVLDMYAIKSGVLYTTSGNGHPISKIEQVLLNDGYAETVLYIKGAEIPWASSELIDYIAAEDAFTAFRQTAPTHDTTDAEIERWLAESDRLKGELERLEALVPEFK